MPSAGRRQEKSSRRGREFYHHRDIRHGGAGQKSLRQQPYPAFLGKKKGLTRNCVSPFISGAEGGNRTRTGKYPRGILSPLRLPIPPPRHGADNPSIRVAATARIGMIGRQYGKWRLRRNRHCISYWRRHPDLNRGIKVLQTSALPLGYAALIPNNCSL